MVTYQYVFRNIGGNYLQYYSWNDLGKEHVEVHSVIQSLLSRWNLDLPTQKQLHGINFWNVGRFAPLPVRPMPVRTKSGSFRTKLWVVSLWKKIKIFRYLYPALFQSDNEQLSLNCYPGFWQWTGPTTTWQKSHHSKVLILTMKLWKWHYLLKFDWKKATTPAVLGRTPSWVTKHGNWMYFAAFLRNMWN
jgi:hypothetical protein